MKSLGVDPDVGVGIPAWSPDGERIAFTQTEYRDGELFTKLYTVNPDGSELVEVVNLGSNPRFPT